MEFTKSWGFGIIERVIIMENYLEEENTYFKNVIKEAIDDLKNNKEAYVFCDEQLQMVKEMAKKQKINLFVKDRDGIFYLTKIN